MRVTFARASALTFIVSTLALGACSGGNAADAAVEAAASETGGGSDVSTPSDSPVTDAPASDAEDATDAANGDGAIDAARDASTDATTDATTDAASDAPQTGDAAPDPACMYFAADEVIALCAGRYLMISRVLPGEGAPSSCQPYFAAGDGRYASQDEALRGARCETRCLYHFATSVTRLYCGRRTGFETLAADGCPGIVRFAEGYFASVEEHDAMYPCRDE